MKCPKCDTANPDTVKFCGECGTNFTSIDEVQPSLTKTIETPREELTMGSTIADRYQIIEELGRGGMGKVYRVLDNKLKEEIALKLIKPEIASDKKTVERFSNELKITRKIGHKNVAKMFDLNEERGIHYITMEYVRGEDLKRLIRKIGRLSPGQAIPIAKQVCEGLEEAHRLGVVHRDLKPQNVMVDEDGNARIMDFGIARSLESKGITGIGVMIGTPEYMSPEQVEAKEVDQRSDIYSLGIIIYEMTTGKLPFEADSSFAVGVKQKSEEPTDPKEINPQIPDDLSLVILKCLEKDKESRYQSAEELRSQLDQIEKGIPTTERKAPIRKPLTSKEITVSFSMKRLFVPALLVLIAVVAALFIWRSSVGRGASPTLENKVSLAVLYFKNNTGDEQMDNWRTALSDSIIADLSQSRYFKVLPSDRIFSILRKLDLEDADGYATEDLGQVAAEGGVNHILTGSLTKAGDIFRIDYIIQEVLTGRTKGTDRLEGQGEESIFSMVDEITRNIKRDFNLTRAQISGDVDRDVGIITTSSTEAFKFYSQGRRAHNLGEYEKSIALMERATAADPEFAMAFRSMAMAYSNIRQNPKYVEYLRKAHELSGRLPDRERLVIEHDFYRSKQTTYGKAIEAYNQLLELYPDERIAHNNSAIMYSALEQWDMALERYQVAIRDKDPSIQGYGGLASVYCSLGRYEEARDVLRDYIENFQDSFQVRLDLADVYLNERKFDQALAEMDKAFSLNPTDWSQLFTRGSILYVKGDLEASRRVFEELETKNNPGANIVCNLGYLLLDILHGKFQNAIEYTKKAIALCQTYNQRGWEVNFHLRLIDLYLYVGKLEEALSHYDQARKITEERGNLTKQWLLLVTKGAYFLKTQDVDGALETAGELKGSIESWLNDKAIREYDYLMGLIEFEKGNYSAAVEHLEKGKSLLPAENDPWDAHSKYSFALGRAYHKIEELEKAQASYEEILPMTSGRVFYPEFYVLALYELGKVFQDQGSTGKAVEYFERFLGFWKDADSGLPEVADARERVAGLR